MLDFWDYNFQGARPIDGEEAAFEALSEHVVHSKPPECLPLAEGTMICHFRVNHGQVRAPGPGNAHGHGLLMMQYCSSSPLRTAMTAVPEDILLSEPPKVPLLATSQIPASSGLNTGGWTTWYGPCLLDGVLA